MAEVVINPATGAPAVAETVYRDLELDAEQAKHDQLEQELEQLNVEFEDVSTRKADKESQLSEQKSLVEGIALVAPTDTATTDQLESGTVGDGGEETDQAESETVLLQ